MVTSARVGHLESLRALSEAAFAIGDIIKLESFIDQALYIDSFTIWPKRMLVRLYDQRGDFHKALRELQWLIDLGYSELNIDVLVKSYEDKLPRIDEGIKNSLSPIQTDDRVWKILLNEVKDNTSYTDDIVYNQFRRKMYGYNLAQSRIIEWSFDPLDNNIDYALNLELIPQDNVTIVKVHFIDRLTGDN